MNTDPTMTSKSTTLSSLNSIPTISAAVSSSGLIGSAGTDNDMRDGEMTLNTIEVVQRKFKDNEKVLSVSKLIVL